MHKLLALILQLDLVECYYIRIQSFLKFVPAMTSQKIGNSASSTTQAMNANQVNAVSSLVYATPGTRSEEGKNKSQKRSRGVI